LQGGINGALSAGCFVGALLAGYPADRFSRKFTLIGASVLFVIGSVFQAATNGVPLLCVGRVLNGLSVGVTSMVVPLYQSEVAPKEIRGRLVAIQQWSITCIYISFQDAYKYFYVMLTIFFFQFYRGYFHFFLDPIWLTIHSKHRCFPYPMGYSSSSCRDPLLWYVGIPSLS